MSGGYYHNGDSRSSGRYDSYYDRDMSSRGSRGRGSYRGSRPHDHYSNNNSNNGNGYNNSRYNSGPRGRGRGYSRQERYYGPRRDERDSYREGRDRDESPRMSPRMSPRDSHYRDQNPRENSSYRDSGRFGEHQHEVQENNGPSHVDAYHRTEERGHEQGPDRSLDRFPDRPRSGARATSQGNIYGHKRVSDAGHVPHRTSGGITPVNPGPVNPGGERKASESAVVVKKPTSSSYSNPWVSLLRLGEGKTAARLEQNHKELASVNEKLDELQMEKIRLSCAVGMLDVYVQRDALNTEICSEKLDEFTYL